MELIGVFLLPLIDIINRRISDKDLKILVSMIVCVLAGLLSNFVENKQTLGNAESIARSILAVYGLNQAAFKLIWEDSSMRAKLYQDPNGRG